MSNQQGFFRTNKFLIISIVLVMITLIIDEAIFSDQSRRVDPQTTITQNLHTALGQLDNHIERVSDIAILDLNRLFNRFTNDEELPYFIYENGNVIYWSTNRFVPKYGTLGGTYLYKFLELKSGQYVARRKVINSAQNRVVEIFALLPLSSDVVLNDSFLEYGLNGEVFGRSSFTLSSEESIPEKNISSPEGSFLFSFDGTERMKIDYPSFSTFIFLLYLISIAAFIWSGFVYSHKLVARGRPYLGVGLIAVFMLVVRLSMLRYEYPLSVIEWSLFQPDSFAASWWQPSLGDFILNQVALLVVVGYGYKVFTKRQTQTLVVSFRAVILPLILLVTILFYYISEVESILLNSQWSFDVARDISYSPFKLLVYFALFIKAIMVFLIGQYLSRTLRNISKPRLVNTGLSMILLAAVIMAISLEMQHLMLVGFLMGYLLIVYNFNLSEHIDKVNYNTFLYFFIAAFLMASVSTSILMRHIRSENLQDKRALATRLSTEEDIAAEFLLSKAKESIEQDIRIQTGITSPFGSKDQIRRLIQRVYLGEYFDKYEIEILLFNGTGRPINSNTSIDYQGLVDTYARPVNATDFEGLYFYRENYPVRLNQYYLFSEIQRYNTTIGYILVRLDRKEQLNNSILPRLLLDDDFEEDGMHFDYGVYNGNVLESTTGDFNYQRNFNFSLLSDSLLYQEGISLAGHHHLGVEGNGENQVYIISNRLYPPKYLITNFAIFFLFMVAAIILVFGVSAMFYNLQKTSTTLSAKIQILLNFAFFLPLIIVSIVVLRLVNKTVEEKIDTQYLSITESAAANLANQLQDFLEGQNENNETLEDRITEISLYAQADINLFNTNGRLIATNQRLIFENEILAPFANPSAMANIVESGNKEQLSIERVGELDYRSTFYGIRSNEDNRLLGILTMPFFDSEEQLKAEQRDILSNILNAFTFIFVIFVVLSFLASRILTYPFKYLTQKIKSTTLSTLNEPLEWQANDEIGLMVREYNKMLLNLEKSKKALALSEKESAWREMAQQVAHEIKNPLTPMKLKLQHLKRVLSQAPDVGNDFNMPIDSLLNQVETLSDIATSFSSFAKMPMPISERLDLVEELRKSVRLFKGNKAEIKTNIPKQPVWVMGDSKLLGRIFNNLILNAEQSLNEDRPGRLSIELLVTHNKARITFEDNGNGIPEDIKEKIFIPKFSTKEEGSGIGLAIAKRGVEHAGGSIWFDSTLGKGTTFYLEFPLTD
ncbi:hypothetical protein BFP97_09390 [Roseivirga sp. 4D4]|uniref:sensor histidine kinase n=1 Tax=Roseivirga sp. 4D4 TaxID=1889784 RepID=UPI0008537DE7|nr:HAMP domain-containing sensor histidine kinase [Roseivirga sp. 4D4]OEK01715.1 hypothetical protein BFP97_09390 [Roseivirga sp. 4D4]